MSPAKKRNERRPTSEELTSMIAEAAYYKAEHRGFNGGSPDHDWWEAEKEIEAMLATSRRGGNGKRARTPRRQER